MVTPTTAATGSLRTFALCVCTCHAFVTPLSAFERMVCFGAARSTGQTWRSRQAGLGYGSGEDTAVVCTDHSTGKMFSRAGNVMALGARPTRMASTKYGASSVSRSREPRYPHSNSSAAANTLIYAALIVLLVARHARENNLPPWRPSLNGAVVGMGIFISLGISGHVLAAKAPTSVDALTHGLTVMSFTETKFAVAGAGQGAGQTKITRFRLRWNGFPQHVAQEQVEEGPSKIMKSSRLRG